MRRAPSATARLRRPCVPAVESRSARCASWSTAASCCAPRATRGSRICRSVDLERLRALPTDRAAAFIERERGLGPWSAGVVCLEGLGRHERGLVGDLSLIKLMSRLRGRWVEGHETIELLEPYGEWAGLASLYLATAFKHGLIPLPAEQPVPFPRPAYA